MLEHLVFKVASEKILKKKKYWYMKKMFVKKVFFYLFYYSFWFPILQTGFTVFFMEGKDASAFCLFFIQSIIKSVFF